MTSRAATRGLFAFAVDIDRGALAGEFFCDKRSNPACFPKGKLYS
jgi:hypothetical protein